MRPHRQCANITRTSKTSRGSRLEIPVAESGRATAVMAMSESQSLNAMVFRLAVKAAEAMGNLLSIVLGDGTSAGLCGKNYGSGK